MQRTSTRVRYLKFFKRFEKKIKEIYFFITSFYYHQNNFLLYTYKPYFVKILSVDSLANIFKIYSKIIFKINQIMKYFQNKI